MSVDRAISVIDAFIAAPRSCGELVVVCRITEDSARRYIAELRARNRLAFDSFAEKGTARGTAATIWRWVPPEQENG
jgi:DNA-binding IclR family transcriptional regulator